MSTLYDTRRYLSNFDSRRTGHVVTDILVVGSGVAGARAALQAAAHGQVTLLCKGTFSDSATHYAQGGIAVAIGGDDTAQRHYEDTLRVGCGLNRSEAVRLLVHQARPRLDELIGWGMELDRAPGGYQLGREGGHTVARVVHARGDQTGAELVRVLEQRVRGCQTVRIFERCFLIDLLTHDGACVGAVTFHPHYGHQLIWAKRTILASGGCGTLWRETTNPPGATGDGVAAAFRAGARLADLELMQFHPTTLYVAGAGRSLISEAVRGEGADLVDRAGERFMQKHHADAELAPRDVVSRAIHQHLRETRGNCVYLDVRHMAGFADRFPHIAQLCRDFQIEPTRDLIPVRPSAHYMIGGIDTGLDGRTSVPGLLCCGECACTGVHGANRMASNSLLEGLVFGAIVGDTAGETAAGLAESAPIRGIENRNPPSDRTELDLPDIRNSLRSVMWRNVGIIREATHLQETCDILDFWGHYSMDKTFDEVGGWELQNQLTLSRLVAISAVARTESTGVHFRADDPEGDPARSSYHVHITRHKAGTTPIRVAH